MSSVRGVNVGGNLFSVTDSTNIAPIETTNFAIRGYAVDRCFIMADGLLYRATAEIESGDPIVINGNCKRTTLDEIISVIETDSDLIAPTEDGATSSADYVVGDEIVRSGILYKVIASITEGDAFVVGNNIDIAGSLTSQIRILANNDDAILNVLGAKNLLPNNGTTQTINGVTFTVNSDGTVLVNGTNTGSTTAFFDVAGLFTVKAGNYILSGCPSGGSSTTYSVAMGGVQPQDYGNGASISIAAEGEKHIYIVVYSGATVNGLTFKPMLRPASIADNTYVPYAMTNRELTTKEVTLTSKLSGTRKYTPLLTSAETISAGATKNISLGGNTYNSFELWYYGNGGLRMSVILVSGSNMLVPVIMNNGVIDYLTINVSGGNFSVKNNSASNTAYIYRVYGINYN